MAKEEIKKVKKEIGKKSSYELIADFITQKKHYKAGESISLTKEGAEYLRKIKKINTETRITTKSAKPRISHQNTRISRK